ncbi:MAG TPA: glycosyltransferase family 9 protein [Chthoniobacterales bacterium]
MDYRELQEDVSSRWWQHAVSGELEEAWQQSDRLLGARVDFSRLPRFFRPLWDGRPIDDAHVWLRCWRGLGDALHFIRYAPWLRARCACLTLEVSQPLLRLFSGLEGIDRLTELDEHRLLDPSVVQVESTELPYVFRSTLASLPAKVPYLAVERGRRVPRDGRLHIGLCWQGGEYDPRRKIILAGLAGLRLGPDVAFWHLQRGEALEQIPGSEFTFENLTDSSMDVLDTASLVAGLDLVITVDSMVAHLAGALARPVWTLLHADPDWRWFRGRMDSPWYPTMRLYRQLEPGCWSDVFTRMRADLKAQLVCRNR